MAVFVGGAVGAGVRFGVGAALDGPADWPWATLMVNIVGCLLLGLISADGGPAMLSTRSRLGAAAGLCGGLTTFSGLVMVMVPHWSGTVTQPVIWLSVSLITGAAAFVVGQRLTTRLGPAAQRRPRAQHLPQWALPAASGVVALSGIGIVPGVAAMLRWQLGAQLTGKWTPPGFAWGTLTANTIASFVLGLVATADGFGATLVGVGFCGALSTFSSFIAEAYGLASERRWATSITYVVASVGLGVGAAWMGLRLGG